MYYKMFININFTYEMCYFSPNMRSWIKKSNEKERGGWEEEEERVKTGKR